MSQNIKNAKRDPYSGAVIFTDSRAHEKAMIRKRISKEISEKDRKIDDLSRMMSKALEKIERLEKRLEE